MEERAIKRLVSGKKHRRTASFKKMGQDRHALTVTRILTLFKDRQERMLVLVRTVGTGPDSDSDISSAGLRDGLRSRNL